MKTRSISFWFTLSLILTFFFVSAFSWQEQQTGEPIIRVTQVDTSHFPNITVYISVTDAFGNPLGVDPDLLVLSENGQPMPVVQVLSSGQLEEVTTVLVMDVSGSMGIHGKLEGAKEAALAYIDHMRTNDQASVMSYNTEVKTIVPFTSDKDQLQAAVESLAAGGDTAMFDAALQAESALAAQQGRKAILLLTDGLDNSSHAGAQDVLNAIDAGGLSISVIGLGDSGLSSSDVGALDEDTLRYLANNAGGVYSYQADPQGLETIFTQLGQALQSELAITYVTPSALHDGLKREITVSLQSAGSNVSAAAVNASYNPGGLIPDVPNRFGWGLFVGLLALLVLLFAAPRLISWATAGVKTLSGRNRSKTKKEIRIKLK